MGSFFDIRHLAALMKAKRGDRGSERKTWHSGRQLRPVNGLNCSCAQIPIPLLKLLKPWSGWWRWPTTP